MAVRSPPREYEELRTMFCKLRQNSLPPPALPDFRGRSSGGARRLCDNIRFTCSWCPGQVALIILVSIKEDVMEKFYTVAGVPVHWTGSGEYGTRGSLGECEADAIFLLQLEECFRELWSFPLGKAEAVVTRGVFREEAGMHGEGRAFDLEAIFWKEHSLIVKRDGYERNNLPLCLGVEAVLRRNFGTVLNWDYKGNDDHIHFDDFKNLRRFDPLAQLGISVGFLQMAMTVLFDKPVGLMRLPGQRPEQQFNRLYDTRTKVAIDAAMKQVDLASSHAELVCQDIWMLFLAKIAAKAFGKVLSPVAA